MTPPSTTRPLTWDDVALGLSCPSKLYYQQRGYPRTDSADAHLAHLAAERHELVALARARFPNALPVAADNPTQIDRATRLTLSCEEIELIDPAIVQDGLLATVDIARRRGTRLELLLVKAAAACWSEFSSGVLMETWRGDVRSKWLGNLQEAAFVMHVFERAFPQLDIVPYLVLPDTDQTATIDAQSRIINEVRAGRLGPEAIAQSPIRCYPVRVLCDRIMPQVKKAIQAIFHQLQSGERPVPHLNYHCRNCQFRVGPEEARNGWRECWGTLADPVPHLFDLHQLWQVRAEDDSPFADRLIAEGKTSLHDMPLAALTNKYAARQRLQLAVTLTGREWIDPVLPRILHAHSWPLHWIDFETAQPTVPHHAGMAPYEFVAFQWSCHTLRSGCAVLEHREWLNENEPNPCVDFARSLREAIGDGGTVYIWCDHELNVLKAIAAQIERLRPDEADLVAWIRELVRPGNRIVDMNALCLDYYYHPRHLGRSKLKLVLPPVWDSRPDLREHPLLKGMGDGTACDPYACLQEASIEGKVWGVREGTGAMRAYHELRFGVGQTSTDAAQTLRRLLLQYCKLDTWATVALWVHWSTSGQEAMLDQTWPIAADDSPTTDEDEERNEGQSRLSKRRPNPFDEGSDH